MNFAKLSGMTSEGRKTWFTCNLESLKVTEIKSNFLRYVSTKIEPNSSGESRQTNTKRWQRPKKVTCDIDEGLNPTNLPKARKNNL